MSDEKGTREEPNGRTSSWNPLSFIKNQKETAECELQALRVDFEPDSKPPPTFVFSEETSEIPTPVSPHTLKLLEAIREDKLEFVEAELSSMKKQEIDKTDRHGFALIHVAARYNLHRVVTTLLEHGADVNIGTSEYRWTPLHLAARFNGLFTVDALLKAGADPSIKGKNGSTPLHFAARRGNDEIVKVLLEHPKVKVDARDSSGKTALHLACSEGQSSVCQLLLNEGAKIKAVTADNTTPLHNAILNGHSQLATMILNRAADTDVDTTELKQMLDSKDSEDSIILHMAALNNDVKTAELCLDHGADVNTMKSKATTPLHIAAAKGNLEMAELLISQGAGVNIKDGDSEAPLHRAAQFNHTKLISLLVENGAKVNTHDGEGRTPFLNAVAAGHVGSARVLLKLGADVNATDLLMKTCVHIAVENEQLKMLAMLLESDPGTTNLYKADLWDRVPLHYAAKSKDIKILELVLSKQKHLSYRDENQKTPLHLAAESSSSKHVEVLAMRIPGVNERDEHGRTPLHSAAGKGHRKACETLLKLGAEVDSKDNNSRTALMCSVRKNNLPCAKTLLDFKASVDLQDTDGDSALHVACGLGHAAIVRLLLDCGASLMLCNKRRNGCLEIAAKAGSSDVVMTIVKHKRWVELENYQTKYGQTSISLLVENFPEAAEVALTQCVHYSPHLNTTDPEYATTYDFKYLDPGPEVKDSSKRFSAVKTMIKHQRERLLLHPLTLKFNERKWSTLGKFGFFSDFVIYFILLIFLSIFVVQLKRGPDEIILRRESDTDVISEINTAENNDTEKITTMYVYRHSTVEESVETICLVFFILFLCKEFIHIYTQRWRYFKDASNCLRLTFYFSITGIMATLQHPFSSREDVWIPWGVVIFVYYVNMMLFLRRYRLFGTYISMYVEVIKTIVQVMVVFVFLVMGFALVFYILFKEQVSFSSVPLSTLRVLVMMVGELEFTDFVNSSSMTRNQDPYNPFSSVAYTIFFLCLLLMSVGLMNLLVGLAVGDTEKMKKLATIKRLALQIEYHIQIEESCPVFITRHFYEEVYRDKPNCKQPVHHRVMEWLQARYPEAAPEPLTEDTKPTELIELREGMMKNRKRFKSAVSMLKAQNKLLRNLALSINPNFQLPEDIERATWSADCTEGMEARHQTSLKTVKEHSQEPTDCTNVALATEGNAPDASPNEDRLTSYEDH